MNKNNDISKHILLFVPWGISCIFSFSPIASYLIAWLGSFYIFYVTLTGKIRPIPGDRGIAEQLMRPIFIVQVIFAGYMACTSIFYFLNALGYKYIQNVSTVLQLDQDRLMLTAQCQRYYCLGHAAFASGIIWFMNYPVKQEYYIENEKLANMLMRLALILFPVSEIFLRFPGLSQFYFQLSTLSFISGTLALAFAIPLKKVTNTLICLGLYLFNFYQATISGFKEPIIISVLVLGLFLYPTYKKLVLVIFLPALLILFMFLPAYVASFRQNAWTGDENADDASKIALEASLNSADDSNWDFLVYRLSEIDMFTMYVSTTPSQVDFYKTQLLQQSAIAMIPRAFWPTKPSTEELIMERVYAAGVVNRNSNVSAKPAYIVDAYLSYGGIGVFILLFVYGAAAQLISLRAERLFGGYILGTALIFSGLFQTFWRGLSLEFMINSVFWSYVSMFIIFKVLLSRNILKKI